ncbi:hypothetical protein GGI21_001218 [Coemansia aciculifera]|uniref:Uncharacterized protein n=1 Tax=Coemansia aciculifera TaxID=417176 RepID=A0ACC1M599_9FUNG|nr:hypothetical protein IWW38_001820 [Coemansia aciculifera]KAJ2910097.1 hypothetical protein GGI21_001218 [Coemansia aciculifera]
MNAISTTSMPQPSLSFSAPSMYLVEIDYALFGKQGNSFFLYFKSDTTANDIIRDVVKYARLGFDVDVADLKVEVSTKSANKTIVHNFDESLRIEPDVEMHVHVFSHEAQDCSGDEIQTTPELFV